MYFNTYCAKALAGIGSFSDTIADRSLPIRLKRRTRDEHIDRFHRRVYEPVSAALRDQLVAWSAVREAKLEKARPSAPPALSDRMQDACEPLLAIADLMGSPWPKLAREALVELCTGERLDDNTTVRIRLLTDIKAIFLNTTGADGEPIRSMSTEKLLEALYAVPESPWGSYYGRVLEPRDLANLLKHFGVKSVNLKMRNGSVPKGYKREPLEDVWGRYVVEETPETEVVR